jgi:rhodanese-related sulfurtransferase
MSVESVRRAQLEEWADKFEKVISLTNGQRANGVLRPVFAGDHIDCPQHQRVQVPELTPSELQAQREAGNVVIVDCRNQDEQDVSMIPGAVRLQNLDIAKIKQGIPVVCYCTVGYRSALETKSLREKGLDAYNLRGAEPHSQLPTPHMATTP